MATEKAKTDNKGAAGCLAIVMLGGFWLYGKCSGNDAREEAAAHARIEAEEKADKEKEATEAAAASARAAEVKRELAAPPTTCGLSIPGTKQRVPVFPTEAGMDEFSGAAAKRDEAAMQAAIVGNRGYWVPPHTKCNWTHFGLLGTTSARITEGPHLGEEVWVPTEWARDQ